MLTITKLILVAIVISIAGCSAADPGTCSESCHARYPEQSRDLLDCVSECSSLNDTNTGDR